MIPPIPEPWFTGVLAFLTGGGARSLYDTVKQWRNGPTRTQIQVDANIATVARARDELAEDNQRLRQVLAEVRAQHADERLHWIADQQRLRADVERLEARLRAEQSEAAARYDVLLEQVSALRQRANSEGT